jgi:hypothetical protein
VPHPNSTPSAAIQLTKETSHQTRTSFSMPSSIAHLPTLGPQPKRTNYSLTRLETSRVKLQLTSTSCRTKLKGRSNVSAVRKTDRKIMQHSKLSKFTDSLTSKLTSRILLKPSNKSLDNSPPLKWPSRSNKNPDLWATILAKRHNRAFSPALITRPPDRCQ